MTSTPTLVTSRLERSAKALGTQRSIAMLAMTAGPPRKPVLAATSSRAAASARVSQMMNSSNAVPANQEASRIARKVTALRV